MTPSVPAAPRPPLADDDLPRRSTAQRVGLALGLAVAVATFAMWAYVLFIYDPGLKVDELADRTFPEAAERVCARAQERLSELPPATAARDAGERADTVERSNAILVAMLDDLDPLVPRGQGRITRGVEQWLGDWRTHVADRADYADRLREDPGAPFLETTKGTRQVSRAIDGFAEVNRMDSCAVPTDVG